MIIDDTKVQFTISKEQGVQQTYIHRPTQNKSSINIIISFDFVLQKTGEINTFV
jgi:hypothetical protein